VTAARFLACSGEPAALRRWLSSLVPAPKAPPRLDRMLDCDDLVIFGSPEMARIELEEARGLLIGRLFRKAQPCERIDSFSRSEASHAAWSGGKTLLDEAWGGYAAFLRDEGSVTVLRDPSGAIPVHHCELDGLHFYFSGEDVALDLGLEARGVDEEFLRQWLTFPFLRTSRTGIAGVQELLPGTSRRTRGAQSSVATLWTPWPATGADRRIADFDEAARQLRAMLLGTVAPQLGGLASPVLELSGGLDSSIVAACLASAGLPFSAANFVTQMSDGDERDYARIVAEALGVPLAELHEDVLAPDLEPLSRRPLRPALSPVLQPLNRAFAAHAREIGAGGFVTGAGGDNLFCYLTTAAPVLDAALDAGPRQALATLRDVAELGGCTLWTAAAFALRKQHSLKRRPKWKRDDRFLAPAAIADEPDAHPWLDWPEDARPGKVEHAVSLVRAQYFLEPEYPSGEAILHPLLSQPLMELCLAIPTWLWLKGGNNRAVARAAFADLLPEEIILRRTKGRLESMCARGYASSRETLADLLLDGELSRRGLLDLKALEAYLKLAGPPRGETHFRVFDLASLELWLRSGRT
jgi:asparagine synthase (glutamine-hydrolysing)